MAIKAINARNQFEGTIKNIIRGDVVSEIEIDIGVGVITSVITSRSIDDLSLKKGSAVVAIQRRFPGGFIAVRPYLRLTQDPHYFKG
jgi:molybdopterin-binding protein